MPTTAPTPDSRSRHPSSRSVPSLPPASPRKPVQLLSCILLPFLTACHGDSIYAPGTTPSPELDNPGIGNPFPHTEVDDEGWTTFTPSADTRLVYVSSSTGDDLNNGLTEATPKRTIAAGKALMRHGFPDWLLLMRGDVWSESLGHWKTSGRSRSEMMVVTSYGDSADRPILLTGTAHGIVTSLGGNAPPSIDHVAFVGLQLTPHLYVGVGTPCGISSLVGGTNLLIEDCHFERFMNNLSFQALDNWRYDTRIRRNIIRESFATTAATAGQGLYASGCDGLFLEENIFDHNGWCETIPGSNPNMFRHALYIQTGSGRSTNHNVALRGNIIANSAATGLQLRCGGVCSDNLFLRNPINVLLGGGHQLDPNGVDAAFCDNVIIDGRDIDASNPRGWSVTASNIRNGEIRGNLIAHQVSGSSPNAVDLNSDPGVGISNLRILDNVIYNWSDAGAIQTIGTKFLNITVSGNQLQEHNATGTRALLRHFGTPNPGNFHMSKNVFHSNAANNRWFSIGPAFHTIQSWNNAVGDNTSIAMSMHYLDPARNIESYSQHLGYGSSLDAFMTNACMQSRFFWRPEFTASKANEYFRRGFNM